MVEVLLKNRGAHRHGGPPGEQEKKQEQKVRAEYSPKTVLAGLAKKSWSVIELVQSLTEDELRQIRERNEIGEIRAFIANEAGTTLMPVRNHT